LTFPDLPRLELDQLLGQLVERAQEVQVTQGRLRGLLKANQVISSDLALPVLLRHIVEAARDLIGARYAAVGVIAPDGHLAEFIHIGMAAEVVAGIGDLPQGKGLLGALIENPEPIRLRRISDDPRSSGFPDGHPPMDSFLGVPIRVRGEVYGNLYLCESTRGEFSSEDVALIQALATTAGMAIDNSRLFDAARNRHEWLQASAAITRRLLAVPDPADPTDAAGEAVGDPLQFIAERSLAVAHADLVTVVLPDGNSDDLRIEIAVGTGADDFRGRRVPLSAGTLSGQVFVSGIPQRVSGPDNLQGRTSITSRMLDVGPMLVMPLLGPKRTHGVLTAVRVRGRAEFTADDLDTATVFANQASLALELAESRREQQRATMLDERDRIAADLHDHVIQRLFASGLTLQSVLGGLPAGKAHDRVQATIGDLDDTISQVRTTIFGLQQVVGAAPSGVRARLLDVVADVAPMLGFEPTVRFSGLLENTLSDDVVADLLAVLREALTNIARHAHARSAEVDLVSGPDRLTLDIRDTGVGIGPTGRRSGLANLRRRAELRGGTFTLAPYETQGTWLSWSIPHR
jgi:signal transduction histidine kinase